MAIRAKPVVSAGNRQFTRKRLFDVVNWFGLGRAGGTGAAWGVVAVPGSSLVQPEDRGSRGVPPAPPPSWPKVIVTTLRLWLQRRVLRVADGPEAGPLARRRAVAAGAVALVLAAAAIAGVTLARQNQPDRADSAARLRASDAALAAAAANRKLAAAWITAQVSRGVIVACDPLMCTALQSDGFPASDLDPLGTGAADPLGSGLVVSTAALRSALGTRLTSIYAPVVLASFGTGATSVAVRVTAPDGAAAYLAAMRADQLARQQAGDQLLHNKNVHVSAAGQADLAAGLVDSRLLIIIAALAHSVPVSVLGFDDSGPGATPGTPLRSMTIDGTIPLPRHASYPTTVLAFLRAQRAPFQASATVTGAGSATELQIEFTAPSPLGLVTPQSPT